MKNDLNSMDGMITGQLMNGNNYSGNSHAVNFVGQYGMDVKAIRLRKLRELIETKFDGNAGQCADALGIKRPQMSRWVTSNPETRQGIAEESARAIEKKIGLDTLWMDGGVKQDQKGLDPLIVQVFPLPCLNCGGVMQKSFVELEMSNEIVCTSCGSLVSVAKYYKPAVLKAFLESLGHAGFVIRGRE